MARFILSRLVVSIPVFVGITILTFGMLHMVPGDPVDYVFREGGLGPEERALVRERLGLNDPLVVQYARWLVKALHGDLGQALFVRRPVARILMDELPYTVRLAVISMAINVLMGLVFGVSAALNYNTWYDSVVMAVAMLAQAMPAFWLGLMLIYVFCVRLNWLPVFGPESLRVLVLPAFVIGFRESAMVSRMTRSGLLEVLSQDYIRTARAKGLPERVVVVRHALRNAFVPVVTVMGLQMGRILGGTVIVETVFARRGIGSVAVNSILQRDFPLVQGTVLLVSTIYLIVNLGVDLLYGYIDPRIRFG